MPDSAPLPIRRCRVRVEWEPRDLWIGAYWTLDESLPVIRYGAYFIRRWLHVYICVLPMLPLHMTIYLGERHA